MPDVVQCRINLKLTRNDMTKISANIVFIKRIFPIIWIVFLIFFVISTGTSSAAGENIFPLVFSVFIAAVGYFVMKKTVWNLV